MCVQSFHMVNNDVPAGIGAPQLDTQTLSDMLKTGCSYEGEAEEIPPLLHGLSMVIKCSVLGNQDVRSF